MELSILMRLRIAASVATGVVLIGVLAWPLAGYSGPLNAVLAADISAGGLITLVVLSFLTGLIAYFVSWPHGREIGILAVPSGLTVWAVRSGSMSALLQLNPTVQQRQSIYSSFILDCTFWLAFVAAGFIGVLLAQKIMSSSRRTIKQQKPDSRSVRYLSAIIALAGTVFINQFCIKMFAQDISIADNKLGSVISQPSIGQIAFAVFVSFGIAAFIVKKFLDVGYIWPAIASVLLTVFAVNSYARGDVLQYFAQQWPSPFFVNSVMSILPVQLVAFGCLGSVAGYWMAVRYAYWRKHEMK
ncbi:MAG: hypothetical protein JW837_05275 [Sedimentisphaerales bacterium]|nr:hypothetical protein [Sedimentisphaerales bacterium]